MSGRGLGMRHGALTLAALVLLVAVGCVSVDGGEAQAAVADLTERVADALKTGSPPPPDGDALEEEYTQKSLTGDWDLTEPDAMEDRVSPAPPEDPPAPGETY